MSIERSWRITKLRQAILDGAPTVGTERGRLVTEAYQETEALPFVIRRARALEKILRRMTLFINEDDLLVGNHGHALRCPPIYPENLVGWMEDEEEMDRMEERRVNPLCVPPEIRPELKEMARYWKGKTLVDRCYASFPEDVRRAREALLFTVSLEKNAVGHCVLDYPKLLERGYAGIREEATERLRALDLTDPADLKKRDFLEAAVITCDAVIIFTERYARLATEMARAEEGADRRQLLLDLARICGKVPTQPAETFHEAVQSVWLAHVVNYIETNAYSMSFGRFDQYLLPYYEKDLRAGTITREQARTLRRGAGSGHRVGG